MDYVQYGKAELSRFKFLYIEALEMTSGIHDRGEKVKVTFEEIKELMD